MGGLWGRLPVTQWVYVIGALALAGLPPLSGFFSKDEILLDAFERNLPVYGVLTVAAFLTAFYMGRQLLMVFAGQPRSQAAARAVESPAIITTPLVLLALLAALGGLLNLPGLNSFSGWLGHTLGEVEALPFSWLVAGVSTALALAGLGAAYGLYRARPQSATDTDPLRRVLGPVFTWMSDKWYVDELYFALFIHFFEELAAFLADRLDARFWHDWFHDRFLAGLVKFLSRVREWQAGYVRRYALAVFLGVVVVLGCFVLTR
jgi:NADH-quinone oxidoreductase subunit L